MDMSKKQLSRKLYRKEHKKIRCFDIMPGDRFTHVMSKGDSWYKIIKVEKSLGYCLVESVNVPKNEHFKYPIEFFEEGLQEGVLFRLPRAKINCYETPIH